MSDDNGLNALKRRLDAIPKEIKDELQKTLLKQANDLADSMRQLAPEDTGALKESITVTPGGQSTPPYSQPGGEHVVPENAVAVTAGDEGVRYPHLVEYGVAHADAQPYFWPAYRSHRRRIKNAISRAIPRAIKKYLAGSS